MKAARSAAGIAAVGKDRRRHCWQRLGAGRRAALGFHHFDRHGGCRAPRRIRSRSAAEPENSRIRREMRSSVMRCAAKIRAGARTRRPTAVVQMMDSSQKDARVQTRSRLTPVGLQRFPPNARITSDYSQLGQPYSGSTLWKTEITRAQDCRLKTANGSGGRHGLEEAHRLAARRHRQVRLPTSPAGRARTCRPASR